MVVTMLVYAATDPSKFHGFRSAGSAPFASLGSGSFGTIDFSEVRRHRGRYGLYAARTFLSVVMNIPSVLLVLMDAVSLEVNEDVAFCDDWSRNARCPPRPS